MAKSAKRGVPRNLNALCIKYDVNNAEFNEIQSIFRKQLALYASPVYLEGLTEQLRLLKELLNRTVNFGESNSVLLIGHRGSGKSALLNKVKAELQEQPYFCENCMVVELNGLVHTDDRIALKDIVHQLQVENSVEHKVRLADTLTLVLETLRSGSNCKSVLFVLDEFDLFCQNKNQTLLYNLFDVVQSSQVPVAIVGLTSRLDVMELLEKRVKSRFSHRILYFFNQLSFDNYMNIAKNLLYLPKESSLDATFIKEWNLHIKKLLDDKIVRTVFQRLYDISKDVRALKKFLLLPVSAINENHRNLLPSDFTDSQQMLIVDSRTDILLGLSVLEFCLIVTIMHLNTVHDGEPLNFEVIYHEFEQHVQKKASLQQFNKTVTMKAFEHLLSLELIKVIDGNITSSHKNYQLVQLLLIPSQVQDALQRYPNLPTAFQHWASTTFSLS